MIVQVTKGQMSFFSSKYTSVGSFLYWLQNTLENGPYDSARYVAFCRRIQYRSCTRDMIHNKIHLIIQGCPRPSIALQCRIMSSNTNHVFSIQYSAVIRSRFLLSAVSCSDRHRVAIKSRHFRSAIIA